VSLLFVQCVSVYSQCAIGRRFWWQSRTRRGSLQRNVGNSVCTRLHRESCRCRLRDARLLVRISATSIISQFICSLCTAE